MQSDIDLNRASPREEGVDVFNVTFFMSFYEINWFLSLDNIYYLTIVLMTFHINPVFFILNNDRIVIKPIGIVFVFGFLGMFRVL